MHAMRLHRRRAEFSGRKASTDQDSVGLVLPFPREHKPQRLLPTQDGRSRHLVPMSDFGTLTGRTSAQIG